MHTFRVSAVAVLLSRFARGSTYLILFVLCALFSPVNAFWWDTGPLPIAIARASADQQTWGRFAHVTLGDPVYFSGADSYDLDIRQDPGYTYDTIDEWDWDFGYDNHTASEFDCNTSHVFLRPGYFEVTLTVDDAALYADDDPVESNYNNSAYVYVLPSSFTVTDDGEYTSSLSELHATWTNCYEFWYRYSIGTAPGIADVKSPVESKMPPEVTVTGLSLEEGETYYFNVRYLAGGQWSELYESDGITVDASDPIVDVTSPAGTTWHKAPNDTHILVSGSATDAVSGVASVQVKIDDGDWDDATYDTGTHTWTYDWQSVEEGEYSVYARATDFAGNDSAAQCDIEVVNATVVYVKSDGDDSKSGWTWDDAKQTIQEGLNTASSEGEGEVWVAHGTYQERITLPAGKGLYGGFVGDEISRTQRPAFPRSSPDSNETVLDGQHGGNVVTATSTNVYNTLNGFTIQHGTSYGVTASSVLTIYNCKVYSSYRGIMMTSTMILGNNEVYENTSYGIYLSGSESGGSVYGNSIHDNGHTGLNCENGGSYTINRNKIEYNNTSGSYQGGGVRCYYCDGTTTIANNFIRGNGATKGGGIYCGGTCLNIYNNTIVDNSCSVSNNGAGICVRNTGGDPEQSVYVCNNIIANNTGGYGIYIDNYNLNYDYTVFLNKNCTYQNGSGNYGVSGYDATFDDPANDYQNQNPGLSGDRCHLAAGSYCIGRGRQYWNGIQRYYGSYDIDDETRIVGTYIDVGCDEVQ